MAGQMLRRVASPPGTGSSSSGRVRLHHGLDGHVDAQVEGFADAGVDDGALAARPDHEPGDLVERPLRRGEADALHVAARLLREPLEGDREVRAPLGLGHRVDLVDDDPARAGEELAGPAT